MPRGFDVESAARHLRRRDRALGAWMRRIGPIEADPRWRKSFDTVDALARAILYQQLSGKAAATIVGRVETAINSPLLRAEAIDRVDDATLRACGVSGNKLLALRDLSRRALAGQIPDSRRLSRLPDDAIVERLTEVRGIGRWTVEMLLIFRLGRWTVEMLLIFRLGRPDVLAVDDLGLRNGAQRVDAAERPPTPKELAARGESWGPYRSLASLYLWRIADAPA